MSSSTADEDRKWTSLQFCFLLKRKIASRGGERAMPAVTVPVQALKSSPELSLTYDSLVTGTNHICFKPSHRIGGQTEPLGGQRLASAETSSHRDAACDYSIHSHKLMSRCDYKGFNKQYYVLKDTYIRASTLTSTRFTRFLFRFAWDLIS
jgi:hypothetical protein